MILRRSKYSFGPSARPAADRPNGCAGTGKGAGCAALLANAQLQQRLNERSEELAVASAALEQEVARNNELVERSAVREREHEAGITAARRIQEAVLPSLDQVPFFRDHASLAMPRDIVSGDLLWHRETADHVFFAVADCTGHGVPGALMTMLGNNLLDRLVTERGITDPQCLLAELDRQMTQLFAEQQGDSSAHHGMDIACFVLNKSDLELSFSGAMLRGHVVRDGQLIELACSRWAIGGLADHPNKQYTCEKLHLQAGDRIVLSTDGYYSQFGGLRNRKLSFNMYRQLLETSARLSAKDAVDLLHEHFRAWKGHGHQVDDVLLVMLDV